MPTGNIVRVDLDQKKSPAVDEASSCARGAAALYIGSGRRGAARHMIDIIDDPSGETYRRLVDFACARCRSFSLVWRDGMKFRRSARDVEERLSPFLLKEARSSEWPGTQLFSGTARVRHYRVSRDSAVVLREAGSLYAWLAPERPEDLAFYTQDGTCLLGSVAHESDGFIDSSMISKDELEAAVPGLQFSIR